MGEAFEKGAFGSAGTDRHSTGWQFLRTESSDALPAVDVTPETSVNLSLFKRKKILKTSRHSSRKKVLIPLAIFAALLYVHLVVRLCYLPMRPLGVKSAFGRRLAANSSEDEWLYQLICLYDVDVVAPSVEVRGTVNGDAEEELQTPRERGEEGSSSDSSRLALQDLGGASSEASRQLADLLDLQRQMQEEASLQQTRTETTRREGGEFDKAADTSREEPPSDEYIQALLEKEEAMARHVGFFGSQTDFFHLWEEERRGSTLFDQRFFSPSPFTLKGGLSEKEEISADSTVPGPSSSRTAKKKRTFSSASSEASFSATASTSTRKARSSFSSSSSSSSGRALRQAKRQKENWSREDERPSASDWLQGKEEETVAFLSSPSEASFSSIEANLAASGSSSASDEGRSSSNAETSDTARSEVVYFEEGNYWPSPPRAAPATSSGEEDGAVIASFWTEKVPETSTASSLLGNLRVPHGLRKVDYEDVATPRAVLRHEQKRMELADAAAQAESEAARMTLLQFTFWPSKAARFSRCSPEKAERAARQAVELGTEAALESPLCRVPAVHPQLRFLKISFLPTNVGSLPNSRRSAFLVRTIQRALSVPMITHREFSLLFEYIPSMLASLERVDLAVRGGRNLEKAAQTMGRGLLACDAVFVVRSAWPDAIPADVAQRVYSMVAPSLAKLAGQALSYGRGHAVLLFAVLLHSYARGYRPHPILLYEGKRIAMGSTYHEQFQVVKFRGLFDSEDLKVLAALGAERIF